MLPDVTVIVVTYNSAHLVDALATTLRDAEQVCIVDNGSSDGTAERVRQRLPHARLFALPRNLGFGGANNAALRECRTPFVALVNPDTAFALETVQRLRDALAPIEGAALIAPQAEDDGGGLQKTSRVAPTESGPQVRREWLSGCFLVGRTAALQQVGGFDERFFLYFEDDDLCLRLREAGHSLWLSRELRIRHAGGRASRPSLRIRWRKAYHHARSKRLYLHLHAGRGSARVYALKSLLAALGAIPALLVRPDRALSLAARGTAALSRLPLKRP